MEDGVYIDPFDPDPIRYYLAWRPKKRLFGLLEPKDAEVLLCYIRGRLIQVPSFDKNRDVMIVGMMDMVGMIMSHDFSIITDKEIEYIERVEDGR